MVRHVIVRFGSVPAGTPARGKTRVRDRVLRLNFDEPVTAIIGGVLRTYRPRPEAMTPASAAWIGLAPEHARIRRFNVLVEGRRRNPCRSLMLGKVHERACASWLIGVCFPSYLGATGFDAHRTLPHLRTPRSRTRGLQLECLSMSKDDAGLPEPDLYQFEPVQQSFATEQERDDYLAAFAVLHQAARDAGVQQLHARALSRPTADTLYWLAASLDNGNDLESVVRPDQADGEQVRDFVSTQVVDGVTFVEGPSANWVIVAGVHGPVLIDTGYPADFLSVTRSLKDAGFAATELVAILITHGHGDHIGNAVTLAEIAECPVFGHVNELPNIRREILEQVSIRALLPHLFRRDVLSWARHAVKAGGKKAKPVLNVRPFPPEGPERDAIGIDLQPVPLPGHTGGHTGYLLRSAQVLVAGDALVTAHPTSLILGPQLLPSVFHGSPARAFQALQGLVSVGAKVVLPGHGPAARGTPAEIATRAIEEGASF